MQMASISNQIEAFFQPSVQPLTASDFLADSGVLSSLIIMPLTTIILFSFAIFLDGSGINVLKARIARLPKPLTLHKAYVVLTGGDVANAPCIPENSGEVSTDPMDDDVLAEANKVSSGFVDESVPILAQDLTKTFMDVSAGLAIKAVKGVSFEVPVSQVMRQHHFTYLKYCAALASSYADCLR